MSDLLVLCYHAVSENWPANMSVSPVDLAAQLETLVRRGYTGATFSDALTQQRTGRTLVVTFDDGLRSIGSLAFPILARLGLPGTVYVPTGFVGTERPMAWPGVDRWIGGPHEGELVPMDAGELRELAGSGWEIGSHTRSHPRLPELGDEELSVELRSSKAEVEDLVGMPCRSIAYPFGHVDRRVANAAGGAGYAAGAALAGYELGFDRLRWPRIGINQLDSARRFALKVSPVARRVRLARLRHAVTSLSPGA